MLELGAELELRDLGAMPLSEKELDELIGARDYKLYLNTRNELYRERNISEKPPARRAAIRLMSRNVNLIKRPVAVRGEQMVIGLDVPAYMKLLR